MFGQDNLVALCLNYTEKQSLLNFSVQQYTQNIIPCTILLLMGSIADVCNILGTELYMSGRPFQTLLPNEIPESE